MNAIPMPPVPDDSPDEAPDEATALRFLAETARLLLEYNTRTSLLEERLRLAAAAVGMRVQVATNYRQLTLYTQSGRFVTVQAPELRINIAISGRVMRIVDEVCTRKLAVGEAIAQLETLERVAERHHPLFLIPVFAAAAMALAVLLSADMAATLVIGLSSALGLMARRALTRKHAPLLVGPFVAAFIGSVLGGILIRLQGTSTPGICLIVPALMLIPGPHFINGLYDVIENNIGTGVARLVLSISIVLSAALGIFLGAWLVVGMTTVPPWDGAAEVPALWLDLLLAGIAACGFGSVYNAPWRVLLTSIACGMIGHGIRYVGLDYGVELAVATLAGCFAIGVMAAHLAERLHVPFAAVAFAGAVPMMPGVLMFQGLGGAMELALAGAAAPAALVAETLAKSLTAGFVVAAMGLGLMLGARISAWFFSDGTAITVPQGPREKPAYIVSDAEHGKEGP